jgi:hypothetical protein
VVQPCVATLAPVTTRIDTSIVTRRYLADWQEPTGEEAEMPDDDTTEALPERSTLRRSWPRRWRWPCPTIPARPDAEIGDRQFAAPGVTPMTDEDAKPLAGLAALARPDARRREDDGGENPWRLGAGFRAALPPRKRAPECCRKRTCMATESEYVPGLARPW